MLYLRVGDATEFYHVEHLWALGDLILNAIICIIISYSTPRNSLFRPTRLYNSPYSAIDKSLFEHANQMAIPHATVVQLRIKVITAIRDLADFDKSSLA